MTSKEYEKINRDEFKKLAKKLNLKIYILQKMMIEYFNSNIQSIIMYDGKIDIKKSNFLC